MAANVETNWPHTRIFVAASTPGCVLDGRSVLLQLHLVVGRVDSLGVFRLDRIIAFDRGAIGTLYGSKSGGYARFAGGDGLAVASAVGVLRQFRAELLDLADVGLSVAGVGGNGKHRDVGGGGIHDEADSAIPRIAMY